METSDTKSIDERNSLVEKLYKEGIKYVYTDKDSEGFYHVRYEKGDD